MVRVQEVEDKYGLNLMLYVRRLLSFNLFGLCKVEKLRQTPLIFFPVLFQSL